LTYKIVMKRKRNKGAAVPSKMNTRGLLKVKGLDINENEEDFAGDRNFELRPSVKKLEKKKKKCC